MYEIVKILDERRVTPTAALKLAFVRCVQCGADQTMLLQNAVKANNDRRPHCPSCLRDTFHYMTDTRFYRIWRGMVSRATDPGCSDYGHYGAVGRGVCDDWLNFNNFHRDMIDGYRDDLMIERVDNAKGYSKENCRWATNMEQQANKNNNRVLHYQGRDMHLAEFCRVTGIGKGAMQPRLNRGMSAEEAVEDYAKSTYKKNRKRRTYTTSSTADRATDS